MTLEISVKMKTPTKTISRMKLRILFCFFFITCSYANATQILVYMGEKQKNHLKAYGIAYWVIEKDVSIEWLLNYRGGSFLIPHLVTIEEELMIRGVSYQILTEGQVAQIKTQIANPEVNMEVVQLEKPPKIAVYTPPNKQPWDDAVTMVLEYAEIPYDKIYDSSIVMGKLPEFDWLHLHHEDFTGQYGKFYRSARYQKWYQEQIDVAEGNAKLLGFKKVSELKLSVAKNIQNFVLGGGFLFTMCSGTDSFDIALAAQNTDICESVFDGDPSRPNSDQELDYSKTFAFKDFKLIKDPMVYEYSNIDGTYLRTNRTISKEIDEFTLFDFSAAIRQSSILSLVTPNNLPNSFL